MQKTIDRNKLAWRSKAQRDACVQQIFDLNLHDSLEFYGVRFDKGRGKFALCPFHAETDGSFAVTDKYWHCFGCNETGGLIKFVAKQFNMSTPDAIIKICADFKLGNLSGENQAKQVAALNASEVKRRIQQKKQQDAEADYLNALTEYLDSCYVLDRWKEINIAMCDVYGENPYGAELANAYQRNHYARYNLEAAEAARSEAYTRR